MWPSIALLVLPSLSPARALHFGERPARFSSARHGGRCGSDEPWLRCAMKLRGGGGAGSPQTFKFPDGSMYRGGVQDGMQHGDGEWRSHDGDVYSGQFACGVFEGHGRYADSRGNTYVGHFAGGAFHGPGTYAYADGRVECNMHEKGQEIGEGVRWSRHRTHAWRLFDGIVTGEISCDHAEQIADSLGLKMPSIGPYVSSSEAEARLQGHLQRLGGDDGRLDFAGRIHMPAHPGVMDGGALVAHSKLPLVESDRCDAIVAECERHAHQRGGWSTARHESYPTTDVPVRELPETLAWLCESLLPDIAWPFLANAFGFALSHAGQRGAEGGEQGMGREPVPDARAAIRVSDAFIVKYNATAGQRFLAPHRDGAVFSFNVALNDPDEYTGGGTHFRALEQPHHQDEAAAVGVDGGGASPEDGCAAAVRSPKGHLLAHSSALMHAGQPTSSGVRYVLVAFCTIDPAYASWASDLYEHVKERVDPCEGREPLPPLPTGLLTAGPLYRKALESVKG